MAKAKHRTWRWVSRITKSSFISVWESIVKPDMDMEGAWCVTNRTRLCVRGFRKLTGISIKPGTCVKIDFGGIKVIE